MADTAENVAEHLETIRADIASLTKSVSQLVSETAGIDARLKQRVRSAAKSAVNEAEKLSGAAMHAAGRGATAAVTGFEAEIERHPLTAVLVALGLGIAIGMFSRK